MHFKRLVHPLHRLVARQRFLRSTYYRALFKWKTRELSHRWSNLPLSAASKRNPEVFVFGRFGGETVGNRFIQLGLLRVLHQTVPERQVFLLSRDIDFTRQGLADMHQLLLRQPEFSDLDTFIQKKVQVVEEEQIRFLGANDLLIFGGGPLLDDPVLAKWVRWFEWARRAKAHTIIAGCGLTDLRNPEAIQLVNTLLANTEAALFRNIPPPHFKQCPGCSVEMALDPAFLCYPLLASFQRVKKPVLAINGRAIDFWCVPERDVMPAEVIDRVLANVLPLVEQATIKTVTPFSTSERGSIPDSIVCEKLAREIAKSLKIVASPMPSVTMMGLIETFSEAQFLISVRMHGFIIGLMMGSNSVHLDYFSGGGKGDLLYREWLKRPSAPSLFGPGSLRKEDCINISEFHGLKESIDNLFEVYASPIRLLSS